MKYQWLSFCDPDKPKGAQFLGAAIVPGADLAEAVVAAWRLGCNPGGEVMCGEISDERFAFVPPEYVGRLMSRSECEAFDQMILESLPS